MTIRRRIALAAAAAVAVTVLLASVGAYLAAWRQVMLPIDESLIRRANVIAAATPDQAAPPGFRELLGDRGTIGRGLGDFDATYYQVIFNDGRVFNVGPEGIELPFPEEFDPDEQLMRSAHVEGIHLRIVTTYQTASNTIVQIARPLTEADQTLSRFAGMLLLVGVAGVAFAGLLGFVVSRDALRPIEKLEDSIADIGSGEDLARRIDVATDDEIGSLGVAFNELLARLEDARDEQVRLVRDAGHELRTPLTALRTNLEILQRHQVPEDQRAAMIDAAHAEVEELSTLVAEIVDLATDRYQQEPVTDVRLGELVASVGERLERRNGRRLEIVDDGSVVSAKRAAIDRAITNLVSNADKWSPDGSPIRAIVDTCSVTVQDQGDGFAEDDIDKVFERFYRSPDARSKPGSGLGLSIVRQIVEDHGGSVFARNRSGASGAEVGFVLPDGAA